MGTADKITKTAQAEVGYREGRSGGHWNNREKYAAQVPSLAWVSDQGQPWCAVFNCWLDMQAGLKPGVDFPLTASCDQAGAWFKREGRWSEYPAVGAWVMFGRPSDLSHTGRVVGYDETYVYTVEGNTNDSGAREGDGVYTKRHLRRDARVIGYGLPKFKDGIKSADPRFAAQPKPKTPKVAAGAAAATLAVGGAVAAHPSTAPEKPKPAPIVATIKAKAGGNCTLVITDGKARFGGTCTILVRKGK